MILNSFYDEPFDDSIGDDPGLEWCDCGGTRVYVTTACDHDMLPEEEVEFLNIEEDIQGQDLLTFLCPKCRAIHKSYRVAK